ncbi:MAG TPA: ABC transporter substrate-binding protein [Actinomycetota bacterium]|nr:ABC transporter substrate-binding protein [Actinomycetota bacterium]
MVTRANVPEAAPAQQAGTGRIQPGSRRHLRRGRRRGATAVAALASLLSLVAAGCGSKSPSAAASPIVVGSPECAHCLAMSLLGPKIGSHPVSFEPFGTLTALTAAMASNRVQVGQIDYTGLVSFLAQGLPIVAISGEVNGGSDFVVSPSLNLAAGDWAGLKAIVEKDKAAGHPFTIASNFGSVQDIELRLQLPTEGIDPNNDLNIVNVPYQGMAAALQNGSAQGAVPVQPFAESITMGNYGAHFAYPYDQPASDLTNVVVVTKSFLAAHPSEVQQIAGGMNTLVSYLKTSAGMAAWARAVEKYDNVSAPVTTAALSQLTPDLAIPFSQVQAFAGAMYTQKLISSPVTTETLQAAIDYTPLSQATGQSTAALGANQ